MSSLFRHEALAGQKASPYGKIVLVQLPSLWLLTSIAAVFALAFVLLFFFGSYTRHSTVRGYLLPDSGLIRIYPPLEGVVVERRVHENQPVEAGDVLFVLSADRSTAILRGAERRSAEKHEAAPFALSSKSDEIRRQMALLDAQIETQRRRVKMSSESVSNYERMLLKKYVSAEQVQQRRTEYLDLKSQLQSMERERQQLAHQLDMQSIAVTATQPGTATAVAADIGQIVNVQQPLLSIVPEHSQLMAELQVPSRAIGFLREGDTVQLRYDAYPYQKFGRHSGTVVSVSKVAVAPSEFGALDDLRAGPVYQVRVRLAQQQVGAEQGGFPLIAGMHLEADIPQDRRRLYEWALEPLLGMAQRL